MRIFLKNKLGMVARGPLFVYLEVTKDCNLRCRHCNIWKVNKHDCRRKGEELTKEDIKKLIDDLVVMGVRMVQFFGGEPLLRDDVFETLSYANKKGINCVLSTNGTLLNEKTVDNIVKAGVKSVIVSLDFPNAEDHDAFRGVNGSFESTINGIKLLKKNNVIVNINTVINSKNYSKLSKMADLAIRLGVDGLRFLPYSNLYPFNSLKEMDDSLSIRPPQTNRLRKELEKVREKLKRNNVYFSDETYHSGIIDYFENKKKRISCSAGTMFVEISAYGEVFPCLALKEDLENIPNISEKSFKEIWSSKDFQEMKRKALSCDKCWLSCYAEASLRSSPLFILKNIRTVLREGSMFFDS